MRSHTSEAGFFPGFRGGSSLSRTTQTRSRALSGQPRSGATLSRKHDTSPIFNIGYVNATVAQSVAMAECRRMAEAIKCAVIDTANAVVGSGVTNLPAYLDLLVFL